jgi:cytochrome c oxidase assembly protein subunit 15
MTRSPDNIWLHRFALLTAAATFCLIWVGGLTTSHGAGMAVPDWPTTYGYNMFFFPYSRWVGGIFYEHSHRLVASVVGLMTVVLSVWLWVKEERAWLRKLGLAAVAAVVFQGVLGGLRVTQMKDVIGVFHATLAQLFFVLVCAIALFTSRWWVHRGSSLKLPVYGRGGIRYAFAFVTIMVLVQLIIGATMRHQHAGLAIPDFPRAYGQWWPDVDETSIARYNQARGEVNALNPITAFQVHAQMTHRAVAVAILCAAAWLFGAARRRFRGTIVSRGAGVWLLMILAQAGLGMFTIWSNKAADVATAHVGLGALSLVMGGMLSIVAWSATCASACHPAVARASKAETTEVLA